MNFFLIQCPHRIKQPIPKPNTEFPRFFFINQIVLTKKRIAVNHLTFKMNQVKPGQQDMGDHFYLLTQKTIICQKEKNDISNKKSECNQFLNWGKLGTTSKKNYLIEKLEAICWKCTFRRRTTFRLKIFSIIRSVILKIQFDAISRVSACSYLLWTS